MYNSVAFSMFTILFNHLHYLISEHFHHFNKKFHTFYEALHIFSLWPCRTWQPLIYFLPVWIFLLWTAHINGVIYVVFFVSAFFHLTCVFKIHPYNMYKNFILILGVDIYATIWIYILHFVYLFTSSFVSTFGW